MPALLVGPRMAARAAGRSARRGYVMSQDSCRHRRAASVAGLQQQRDEASEWKGGPAVGPARVSIGNAAATRHRPRCGGRRYTETWGAAPSLHRTVARYDAP